MLGPIFSCSGCSATFRLANIRDDNKVCCPCCHSTTTEFEYLEREDIWFRYTAIYAANWDQVERFILRDLAESHMTPFNPLSNEM